MDTALLARVRAAISDESPGIDPDFYARRLAERISVLKRRDRIRAIRLAADEHARHQQRISRLLRDGGQSDPNSGSHGGRIDPVRSGTP